MSNIMETNRQRVLDELLSISKPLELISQSLKHFSWDFEGKPALIRKSHLVAALSRFLDGSIIDKEIESWANLIECREDLESDKLNEELIDEIIYELANPELEGSLNQERCIKYLEKLK